MYIYTYGNVRRGGMATSDPERGLRFAGSALHILRDLFVGRKEENVAVALRDVRLFPDPICVGLVRSSLTLSL